MNFLDAILFGNTVRNWLTALLVAAIVYVALRTVKGLVLRHLNALARRTRNEIDDILSEALHQTRVFFLIFLSLFAGTRVLALAPRTAAALQVVGVVVLLLQVAVWAEAVISSTIRRRTAVALEQDAASATTWNALGFVSRLVLWSVLLLMGLANLGIEIGPLLAGLGVGGIAVALALQNILGDLFASLSIVLDKPFVVGDFIIVGDMLGTVERVGLKTTRIRSLSGEQLVLSNADLLSSRIRNFKRMYERRVLFHVGVTYQTSFDQVAAIPALIRAAVERQELTRFDRSHFQRYGDFSLNFETVYYVLASEYNTYMDIQQAINLEIFQRFAEEGIEFAYPTQTLHLQRAGV